MICFSKENVLHNGFLSKCLTTSVLLNINFNEIHSYNVSIKQIKSGLH